MLDDPLDIRGWPTWSRIIAWGVLTGAFAYSLTHLTIWLNFHLVEDNGWIYVGLATLLISWFSIDGLFERRTLYARIGKLEGTLKHGLRFLRRVMFLTLIVVGLALALIENTSGSLDSGKLENGVVAPLAVLAGAYFASFGWMYTRFEQEKADRASATLEAIRDQLYGPLLSDTYRKLKLVSDYCRKERAKRRRPKHAPFTKAELALRIEDVVQDIKAGSSHSIDHEFLATQFINALNQLALGVRKGQFDLSTIRLLLRPRFLVFACRYRNMIAADTDAKPDPHFGNRLRAQTRTYEHFLWLITKIDLLESDLKNGITYDNIVLPPDHIIGSSRDERVAPPGRTGGSWFKWDNRVIAKGLRRVDEMNRGRR